MHKQTLKGKAECGGREEASLGKKPRAVIMLDLSCILEPTPGQKVAEAPVTGGGGGGGARGGLYLSGRHTVLSQSHRLPKFNITVVLNAADNVQYTAIKGMPFSVVVFVIVVVSGGGGGSGGAGDGGG